MEQKYDISIEPIYLCENKAKRESEITLFIC